MGRPKKKSYLTCLSGIATTIYCPTNYNLADMGTKALNGSTYQFLLENQAFHPVEIVGECETEVGEDTSGDIDWHTNHVGHVLSPLDRKTIHSCLDKGFLRAFN